LNELNFDDLSKSKYAHLVKKSVYYSLGYKNFVSVSRGKMIFLEHNNFIIPIEIYKRGVIKYSIFSSEQLSLKENCDRTKKADFLNQVSSYLRTEYRIHFVLPTKPESNFDSYPNNSIRIPFGNYLIDLTRNEDDIYNSFHKNCRKSITSALNNNMVVKFGGLELLDDIVFMEINSSKKSKEIKDNLKIRLMFQLFPNNIIIGISYYNNQPQGGAVYMYDVNICNSLYGVRSADSLNGSRNLLHWEAIKYMKSKGVQKFSFVGARIHPDLDSKYTQIQKFKESFGPILLEGFMFKIIYNYSVYALFKLLYLIKYKTKYSDVIDQELHKWENLQNKENRYV